MTPPPARRRPYDLEHSNSNTCSTRVHNSVVMRVEARLRAFAAIARCGSVSKAAEELYVSQPAVSKHLAALERELGQRLVTRGRHGAALTPAGHVLADYVLRAEALLANAARALAAGVEARVERSRSPPRASPVPTFSLCSSPNSVSVTLASFSSSRRRPRKARWRPCGRTVPARCGRRPHPSARARERAARGG